MTHFFNGVEINQIVSSNIFLEIYNNDISDIDFHDEVVNWTFSIPKLLYVNNFRNTFEINYPIKKLMILVLIKWKICRFSSLENEKYKLFIKTMKIKSIIWEMKFIDINQNKKNRFVNEFRVKNINKRHSDIEIYLTSHIIIKYQKCQYFWFNDTLKKLNTYFKKTSE